MWGALKRVLSSRAALALVVYVALTLLWDQAAVKHMGSTCACWLPGDAAQYTWAFGWFPHALFNGESLLHTRAMWSPTGINLAGATATPLLAFLYAPLTWLWSPIVAYNVAEMVAPVTAAFSAYWLCRYVTKAHWASVLGGAAYGFSSYEVLQGTGHLHLVTAVCPPLAVLLVLLLLDQRISRRWFVALLTVILVAQLLISTEVLFTMTVMGVVALTLAYALGDQVTRAGIRQALRPIFFAVVCATVVASPYIYDELHASSYSAGAGTLYPTDLLNFFLPEPDIWVGGTALHSVTSHFGSGGESDAYLGPALIVMVAWFVWIKRRERVGKLFAGLLVVVVLWILGGHLYVDGHQTIPLPYRLVQGLPGFKQIMQGRVALYLSLIAGVILAMALAQPGRRPRLRWCLGVLAIVFTLPNLVQPSAGYSGVWTNPSFFRTNLYKRYLKPNETILPIRWGWLSESSMWQAEDHFYFNLASGYFTTTPLHGWRSSLTHDLWNDTPHNRDAHQLKPFLKAKDVGVVVVQGADVARWAPVLKRAGLRRTASVGGVVLYSATVGSSPKT
jgi:hypothetical protein